MRLDLIGTVLDGHRKADLARRLIATFCEIEVGRDLEVAHSGFVVHINETPADSVFMGDAPMVVANPAGRAAIMSVQVMAGPWTDEMKASLFERLEPIVREVAEIPKQGARGDFWMTIVEVPEGGWGVGGRPVSIAKLAPAFSDDRQERIREYLSQPRRHP